MDERHVGLLRRHRETFVQSVEVERLFPMLEEIISPAEINEMKLLANPHDRVKRLMDILPAKGRPAFTYLCLALETTYPHLLTVMCIGRDRDPTGSSPSTVSPYTSESDLDERPRIMISRPNYAASTNKSYTLPARVGSREHGSSMQSSLDSDEEPLIRPPSITMGPLDARGLLDRGISHREAMIKLEKLSRENKEVLKKYDQAQKEAAYYCKQHRSAMSNGDQLRSELQGLQQEYADLMAERNAVQEEINDFRERHEEDAKELSELRVQSREVVNMSGQPDVRRMYEKAMDRYDSLKHEYDNLQKRYSELKGSHVSGVNKMERLQEDISQLQIQIDSLRTERDSVVKERNTVKQQYSDALREFEKSRRTQEEHHSQEFKAQQELRLLKQSIRKAQVDRDQAVREYRLVMSERDVVHKEIEKLQDEAQLEATKRKSVEEKLMTVQAENTQLQQKLVNTLREHDQAVKRISDLSERCRELINNTMMAKKEREGILHDLRKYEEELQVARHERKEALEQLEEVVQERYQAKQEQAMTNNEYQEVNKEVESLRRKEDNLSRELSDALQESENAKKLRDYAFTERDKIVAERESIRTLCDKLRRERDRAVSDYAEALRKTDDMERKKNEVTKELNQVKQSVIQQEEKEARMRQLIAHHSRDSAIDADSQEWHMEMVELETVMDDGDMTMLGFDIGDCNKDHPFPDDCSLVITKVDKGSIADGRLRVNDCVVRVNNVDLTNGGDRNIAVQAVKNSRGILNMVVKRRRPSAARHHPVKLFFGGKDHGLVLENGIFIARIVPGSAAAKEGTLLPGDRILYVDGYPVEDKTVSEVEKMLSSNSESVMLSVVRVTGMPMSSSTSPTVESIRSHETSSSKSSLSTTNPFMPAMEVLEPRQDRNGNPQQTLKMTSAQSEKAQAKQALKDFVRRESMHSRESSHESCSANSGEQTPLALSRQNSFREPIHVLEMNRGDKRLPIGEYPQTLLPRGEIQQIPRRSYMGQENLSPDFNPQLARRSMPNGQYTFDGSDKMRHSQTEFLQSPGNAVHRKSYHSHENSREENNRSFSGDVLNGKSASHASIGHQRTTSHDKNRNESGNHGHENGQDNEEHLTNGELRPNRDANGPESPPVQFTRDCPPRESFHARSSGRDKNRKGGVFDEWGSSSYYGPHVKVSQLNREECNNENGHNGRLLKAPPSHVNGNVQHVRPWSQDLSFKENHSLSPHFQQKSDVSGQENGPPRHSRSLSSSSGRDMDRGFQPKDQHVQSNDHRDDPYADWSSKNEINESVFGGYVVSKTAPVKTQSKSSPSKDMHSTWPKIRGPPDSWKGRKRRKREPIPNMDPRNSDFPWGEPEIVKPTPPSRTSSFKASLRHVKTSSGSSSGSESRHQPSSAASEGKGQGSLPRSPTVKVSSIDTSSHSHSNISHSNEKHSDLPERGDFFNFDPLANKRKQDYVPVAKVEIHSAQTSVFRPVSSGQMSRVKPLPSESAIVPQDSHQTQAKLPMAVATKRPQEPLQIVRADPVVTIPPWDSMSLPSEPGTPNRYPTWQGYIYPAPTPTPTPAQVIIQQHNVPSYRVDSYRLHPVTPSYHPPSPGGHQEYPFYSSREERAPSRTSLPDHHHHRHRRHQMSNLSTNSDFQLDMYRHSATSSHDYSTASLPGKFKRFHVPGCRPSPGPSSSSDITSNSGHSSPTSPSLPDDSPFLSPATSLEPSINITYEGGPNDPRLIEIERTLEPGLGFSIKEGSRGGIFVNTVTEGSLAARGGLKYGDQILEFNGINLRRATHELAAHILTRAGNSISIKAQYCKDKIGDQQRDSMCSSTQSTPIASQTSTRTNSPTPTVTPPTPRASRTQSILSTASSSILPGEQPRFAFLKKTGGSLGVGLYGGNKVGIFVSEIESTSVAIKPDGLRVGDQILEYNGVDLRNATAEQAAIELQKPAEDITILVLYNISKFNSIQSQSCDELFVRALVDYSPEKDGQLSFKRDDVLCVDDTMYNGSFGVWNAWCVNPEGQRTVGGQILSKTALHREMVRRRLLSEGMQEEELRTASSRRSSGPARRSFLKRKKKHQHNNSKDSRELSEGSITDVPIQEDSSVPTYLRVERLDMHIKRPVILLGPLTERVAQKMAEESPDLYARGFSKMVQSSHQLLEKDIESGLIIDFQRKDNMFEVIHTSTIKDICKRGCHCILDSLSPVVAERLQRLQLHPIVIFVKFKSIKSIKEQKDPHFLRDKVTNRQAKELFEMAGKMEQEYKSLFSEIIQGGNLASISTRLKKSIDNEQRKPIWIPSSQPL